MIVRDVDVQNLTSFDFFNDAKDTASWLRAAGRATDAVKLETAWAQAEASALSASVLSSASKGQARRPETFDLVPCIGCGQSGLRRDRAIATLGRAEVIVYRNMNKTDGGPRESCVQKARDKLMPCAGCGSKLPNRQWVRNALCDGCRAVLDRQTATASTRDSPLVWAALDTRRLLGELAPDEEGWRMRREFTRQLAQLVGVRWQTDTPRCANRYSEKIEAYLPSGQDLSRVGSADLVFLELPQARLEALTALCDRLASYGKQQHQLGVERGHSALLRLANGEVSVERYESDRRR